MNQPEKNTAKDIQQEKTGQEKTGIEEEAAQQREMQLPEGEAAGGIIKQEAEGGKREKRKKRGEEKDTVREIASWVFTICMAVIAALLIRSFIFIIVQVDGPSMMNTLHNENRLFVWRAGYTFGGEPQRGDIVICEFNSSGIVICVLLYVFLITFPSLSSTFIHTVYSPSLSIFSFFVPDILISLYCSYVTQTSLLPSSMISPSASCASRITLQFSDTDSVAESSSVSDSSVFKSDLFTVSSVVVRSTFRCSVTFPFISASK